MASGRERAGAAGFGGGQEPRNQHNSGAAGFGGGQEVPAGGTQQYWASHPGSGGQDLHPGGQGQMRSDQQQQQQRRPEDEDEVIYYYREETTTTGTEGDAGTRGGGLGTETELLGDEAAAARAGPGTGQGNKYML